jgi:RND family efflux transporter MFP subunit
MAWQRLSRRISRVPFAIPGEPAVIRLPRAGLRPALPLLALAMALAACDDAAPPPPAEIRPVRFLTVESRTGGDLATLTGVIEAEQLVSLSFRIGGRVIERAVNAGDAVVAGQVVARLDPKDEENGLRAARAAVVAARGQLIEARNNYVRQRELLESGFTTRVRYDQAVQTLQTVQAQMDTAQAQMNIAENRLGFTVLVADASGTVTARGVEPGEVVQPGQMVIQVAREDGRDAVFDVPPVLKDQAPADPAIDVFLTMDPSTRAVGRVREVSPRADPVTGTFRVRVGLDRPPPTMRLGTTVTGQVEIGGSAGIHVPASALNRSQGTPAVWVIDPATETVALRPVELGAFDAARALVVQGLEPGDLIVTAGVQALRPGQKVRLLGAAGAGAR